MAVSKNTTLRSEFDRTVAASQMVKPDLDAAAIQVGRDLADQIDYAKENLTGSDLTKALYLMPHLMAVLDKLLATPKARAEAKPASGTKATKVSEMRNAHGIRSIS